jgi:endonuclease YncB( thermonuclease family)
MRQFVLGIVALVGLWSGPVDAAVLHLSDDSTRDAAACEQTDTAVLVQIGETWEVFPHAGVTRIDGACERVSPEPAAEPAPPATPSPVPAPPVAAVATFPVAYAGTDAFWGWRVSNGAGVPTRPSTPYGRTLQARVVRVVDGDTIEVQLPDGRREKVRYIGINTPEIHHPTKGAQPGGAEAREMNRRLVEGKTVDLEFDVQQRDKYGRLLAYVRTVDGTHVNAELVSRGYAGAATFPPNVRYAEYYRVLERQARAQNRGLWGSSTTMQASTTLDGTVEAGGLTSATPNLREYTSYGIPSSSSNGDSASSTNGPVKVREYYRSDGTYVPAHTRSAPRRR